MTSTKIFTAIYATATNIIVPCTRGKSLATIAFTNIRPNPGLAKTASIITVPASTCPNCKPKIVTTGKSALRKA